MTHQRIICKSVELIEKGKGIRFSVPELGDCLSAFVVRFEINPYAYVNQ